MLSARYLNCSETLSPPLRPELLPPLALLIACVPSDIRRGKEVEIFGRLVSSSSTAFSSITSELNEQTLTRRPLRKNGDGVWAGGVPDKPSVEMDILLRLLFVAVAVVGIGNGEDEVPGIHFALVRRLLIGSGVTELRRR